MAQRVVQEVATTAVVSTAEEARDLAGMEEAKALEAVPEDV